jgi:hypothetical protein
MLAGRAGRIVLRCFGMALGLVGACRSGNGSPGSEPARSSANPPDSLVLADPSGVEVWFTLARSALSPTGADCVERGLEIRRQDGRRVQVPLLYTGDRPTLLNDSTMRAIQWTNCRPQDAYLVDLRSGRPVRDRKGRISP